MTRAVVRVGWQRRRTPRASTTARGYGAAHQGLRRRVDILVQAGRATCWRCGLAIRPGEPWHLGHDDEDRTVYRGPEHPDCNTGAAAEKAARNRREPQIRRLTRW